MKWLLVIVGVVLMVLGGLWILQGVHVIPLGFMAGHPEYAVLGVVVMLIGAGLLALGYRRRKDISKMAGSGKQQ